MNSWFKNRFFYLLISLVSFLLLNPIFAINKTSAYLLGILFSIMLILCVYIIEHSKVLLITAICLALLTFTGHWLINIFELDRHFFLYDYIITSLFFLIITIVVLSYVAHHEVITASTLYGAVSAYLLLGLLWCFIYLVINTLEPNSFSHKTAVLNNDLKTPQFIYYSFVTLSTLGFGDMTPITNLAKTFSWFEAITGQIYLTVWIAQLVGLHISQRMRKPKT